METREKRAQRFAEEVARPLRLDGMSNQEKTALTASLQSVPWYAIAAHGGVSGGAFRIPENKVLVLITPPGQFGRSGRDEQRLKEARAQVLLRISKGMPQTSRVPPIPESYIRIFIPGDWAPDSRLAFKDLPFRGVLPLSLLEKPFFVAFNPEGRTIFSLLARYAESRSLVPHLQGADVFLSDLFRLHLPNEEGVFISEFCRFTENPQKQAFEMALNKVGFRSRQTIAVLRDPYMGNVTRNWRSWPLDSNRCIHSCYAKLKEAVADGSDPDICKLKAMFPTAFYPMTREKFDSLFPILNTPKQARTASGRTAQIEATIQKLKEEGNAIVGPPTMRYFQNTNGSVVYLNHAAAMRPFLKQHHLEELGNSLKQTAN
jgi:hypothetical protein